MARNAPIASEMACRSACPSGLSANACILRKRAASAASTRCRNDWGSPSRSAASNSRCQCGYLMVWDVELFWSVTTETNAVGMPMESTRRQLLYCIALRASQLYGSLDEPRFAAFWWPNFTTVVIIGQQKFQSHTGSNTDSQIAITLNLSQYFSQKGHKAYGSAI